METIVWVHDHTFVKDARGEIYSASGGINSDALTRYLRYFDLVRVVGRDGGSADGRPGATVARNGLEFHLTRNFSNPIHVLMKRRQLIADIDAAVRGASACIILLPSSLGLIAAQRCRKLGIPYIIQTIGCAWDALWNHGSLQARAAAFPNYLAMRHAVARADHVIYITEKFLQSRYPNSRHTGDAIANVIVPASDTAEILTARERRINLRSSPVRVGLVGSLNVNYKGHDTAIRAISLVLSRVQFPVVLELVGTGDSERWSSLAKSLGVEKNVIFLGKLPGSEAAREWMCGLDVYVQPSTAEGHGRAVVEAMSTACPTIASNIGGLSDSLPDEFLFDPGNAEEVADMIVALVSNPDLSKEHARTCLEHAQIFRADVIEAKRDQFFREFRGALT